MQSFSVMAPVLLALVLATAGAVQGRAATGLEQAESLAEQGDIAGALAAYERVVQARPEWGEAHTRLGGMQLLKQHYAAAVRSFQQAISLGDPGARPFIGMGMAYLHMGQYGPARAAFGEAKMRGLAHSPDIDRLLLWLDDRASATASEQQ